MDGRVVIGATVTAAAMIGGVFAGSVEAVLGAGAAGGAVAGLLSRSGHVGAGARAGAYGGASGFVLFVLVGTLQSIAGGDLAVPAVIGAETLLIATVVVPIHALLGAVAAAVGVRIRRLLRDEEPQSTDSASR